MSRIFIWPSCASLKSDCSNPAVSINLTFHSTSYYGLNFTQDRSAASMGASLVNEVTRSVSQEKIFCGQLIQKTILMRMICITILIWIIIKLNWSFEIAREKHQLSNGAKQNKRNRIFWILYVLFSYA